MIADTYVNGDGDVAPSTIHYQDDQVTLYRGDALETLRTLPDESVDCAVTSPPYLGLRDYGEPGQYGLEASPAEYVEVMRKVFAEVRRVLAKDGTLWLNLGDSYAHQGSGRQGSTGQRADRAFTAEFLPGTSSLPAKNLLGIPWRTAFALQDDGWILRNAIVWAKTNPMPEPTKDRLSTAYEQVFLLTRAPRYWFDLDAIREESIPENREHADRYGDRYNRRYPAPGTTRHGKDGSTLRRAANPLGRNPGDVWSLPTQPFPAAHFAIMSSALAQRCIKAGCRPGGVVLDPFAGSCTTGMVANQLGHRFVGIDLSATYLDLALKTRLAQASLIDGFPAEVSA